MAVIILAGGRSVRFGRCKAAEPIGGESLLSRIIRLVAPLDPQIIVAAGGDTGELQLPAHPGLKTVTDAYPGCGPLAGIHSGLLEANSFHSLVVACDMPFLDRPLLRYLLDLAHGSDAVVPRRTDGRLDPLHAVYSRACLAHLELLLEQGKYSLYDLMPLLRVRYVESIEIERFDPEHTSFFNINTLPDLERAQSLTVRATKRRRIPAPHLSGSRRNLGSSRLSRAS